MAEVDNPAFTLTKLNAVAAANIAADIAANLTAFGEANAAALLAGTPRASGPVPGVPTGHSAAGGAGAATITFTAPAANGGSSVTHYIATSSPGGFTKTGTASPLVYAGLAANTYTYTVKAVNAAGGSVATSATNSAVTT